MLTETKVIETVTDIQNKAREKGIEGCLKVDGFLYDFYDDEEQVA